MEPKIKYEEQQSQIQNELALLKQKLKQHQKKFNAEPSNWCFVGDLGNVLEKLKEVNQFLNG
jgi:hypothetical protein